MTRSTQISTKNVQLLLWQALTPVHAGTGQTSASVIDLPIAREVATGFPVIPASSIKGVLRDGAGLDDKTTITDADKLYGYADKKIKVTEDGEEKEKSLSAAARLTFTDARLLWLPVRSYRGTFAYLTCPLILKRLRRDLSALGLPELLPDMHEVNDVDAHLAGEALIHAGQVLFEDIDLTAKSCDTTQAIAKKLAGATGLGEDLISHFAIVSDNVFSFFSETATEVTAHIRLDMQTKTVKDGALWYEETLPAESLLSSFVIAEEPGYQVRSPLQLGGKGSVGKGLLSVKGVPHA